MICKMMFFSYIFVVSHIRFATKGFYRATKSKGRLHLSHTH